MAEERLQKIIARAGIASRRAAEQLITEGHVRINGRVVTELGAKADPRRDRIEVDGERLVAESLTYVVLHKPRLCVSTLDDPEGRPTVADLVKSVGVRVHPVGRLDFHTSGTLLLTNDGDLTQALLHPRKKVPKIYVVKVQGEMTEAEVQHWRDGVQLEDGKTLPAEVSLLRHENGKTWLEVTLFEGRNQQIRRMGEATRHPVMRLARQSFAGINSEGLRPGTYRHLTVDELIALREAYGFPRRIHRPEAPAEPSRAGRPQQRRGDAPKARARGAGPGARSAPSGRAAEGRSTGDGRPAKPSAPRPPQRGAAPARPAARPERRQDGGARPAQGGGRANKGRRGG